MKRQSHPQSADGPRRAAPEVSRRWSLRHKVWGAVGAALLLFVVGWVALEARWIPRPAHKLDVAAAAGPVEVLTVNERKELRQLLEEAELEMDKGAASWDAVTTPAALQAVSNADEPCPVRFRVPNEEGADSYVAVGSPGRGFGQPEIPVVAAGQPIPSPFATLTEAVAEIRRRVEQDRAEPKDLMWLRGRSSTHAFVVAEDQRVPVVEIGAYGISGYRPGTVTGRAFLYAYRYQRVICSGPVDVANREGLRFPPTTTNAFKVEPASAAQAKIDEALQAGVGVPGDAPNRLRRDLEIQLRMAIRANLRGVVTP